MHVRKDAHTHTAHTHTPHLPHLTDQTFEGQTILQHQAITHTTPTPFALYIPPFQIYGCCM